MGAIFLEKSNVGSGPSFVSNFGGKKTPEANTNIEEKHKNGNKRTNVFYLIVCDALSHFFTTFFSNFRAKDKKTN